MVNTEIKLVPVINNSARESFPLQDLTRAAPTLRVVGAAEKTASPAPNSGGVKGMALNANQRRGVTRIIDTKPHRRPSQCFSTVLRSAVFNVRPLMKNTIMMLIISTSLKVPAVTETTALPGAGASMATMTATRKLRGSHCFLINVHSLPPKVFSFERHLEAPLPFSKEVMAPEAAVVAPFTDFVDVAAVLLAISAAFRAAMPF